MKTRRILVVEDDAAIRQGVVDALQAFGYQTAEAGDGAAGLDLATRVNCDLVLLDLVLPKRDGLSILKEVRVARPGLPVIILTAKGDEDDRVAGLRLGADDYVVKPFSVKELIARVEALLRRTPERPSDVGAITFPAGVIDLDRCELRYADGSTAALSERERELVRYLAANRGRAISRDELLERVWRVSGGESRTVDMHVARLREKLRDDPAEPRVVVTVRGKGYMVGGMNRPLHVWSAFALAAALLVAAVGWISLTVLQLERNEAVAIQRANQEESIRLALWRMDSTVGSLVAQESARPYYAAADEAPYVRAHFQLDQKDVLTAPPGSAVQPERLAELRRHLHPDDLRALFPPGKDEVEPEEPPPAQVSSNEVQQELAQQAPNAMMPSNAMLQNSLERSKSEWRARAMNAYQQRAFTKGKVSDYAQQSDPAPKQVAPKPVAAPKVTAGAVKALWMNGELLFARGVTVGGRRYVQGAWLDWPTLKKDLLESLKDLLPGARLWPVEGTAMPPNKPGEVEPESRMLATIPVRVEPFVELPLNSPLSLASFNLASVTESPLRISLVAAWSAVLLAALAVAMLLTGVLSLSERRATFVSAVTHELRTPLTTFRLYTDLLAQDIVTDPEKRRTYLDTLRREAERLGHLVENVLAYARLERGKSGRRLEPVKLSALIDRCRPRLVERAQAAGLELALELPPETDGRTLSTDTAAIEQVLFNLVDNACKYATAATDRRLEVRVVADRTRTTISVRDFGAGIPRAEARKLFQPFSRSAEQAAGSAPGVGLGLALSRQLARQLGGDLTLERTDGPGALFVLALPPCLD